MLQPRTAVADRKIREADKAMRHSHSLRRSMGDVQSSADFWSAWWEVARRAHTNPQVAARLVREANGRGEHMLALSLAEKALAHVSLVSEPPVAVELRQQLALALVRSGAAEEAMEVLRDSLVAAPGSAETLGLCGRVHKDLADRAVDEEAAAHRQRALEFYAEGFAREQDAYCGINASVLAALTGDLPRAREMARRVLQAGPGPDRLWSAATEGMARIVCGEPERAREALIRADRAGEMRRSDLAVVRREARRLSGLLHDGRAEFYDTCFRPAAVAVFAGQGRALGDRARADLARWLERNHVVCVWAAAASGEEGEFLEGAAALGLETCAVLPQPQPHESCAKAVARAALSEVLEEEWPVDPAEAAELARHLATARAAARAAAWDVPWLAATSEAGGPACWAGVAVTPFVADGGRNGHNGHGHSVGASPTLTIQLCVRVPESDMAASRGWEAVQRICAGHRARRIASGEEKGCYFFAWPTVGEAGRAVLDLQQELAAVCPLVSCTFVLDASANGGGQLRRWAGRVYPGRIHATGRFADLAVLQDCRDFDLCYVGTLDREATPLGVRLYRLREVSSARGGGVGLPIGG